MNHPAPPVTLESLRAPVAADLQAVDHVIARRLASDVVLIRTVARYIVESGGKRLRQALLLIATANCAAQGNPRHKLTAVVELIHTATRRHADVVDESSLRRRRKTANAGFGNAASVLVGDFLYTRGFHMMVDV